MRNRIIALRPRARSPNKLASMVTSCKGDSSPSAKRWSKVHGHAAASIDVEHRMPIAIGNDRCLMSTRAHHVLQHHLGKGHPRVLGTVAGHAGSIVLRLRR